ncbi:MAG: hypothetical protein ACLGHN_12050 [Bacteriovoracia bacterium]
MKLFTLILLLVSSSFCYSQVKQNQAEATIQFGKVLVKWNFDPKFKYSIERRTKEGPYEVLATDITKPSYYDLTAEPNTLYYYLVKAYSQEIKLDVASELIYSSDFESITFTGCGFCSHNISTGIKFDRNRRYSIRFYVRSFDISRGSFSVSLGGLKGGRWGPYQPGEKEFNVEYHPELLDPRDQVFSDSLIFYMSGNLNVVIDKIEIYQKEKE